MSSFVNVVFTMELAVPNTTLNTTPINAVPATNTLTAQTVSYNPSFQVNTSPTTIPIPPTASGGVQVCYVKNLDTTNAMTFTYTPNGGSPTTVTLPAGGVFIYFVPTESSGGIGTLSATAVTAALAAEVFLAY
jgi:hypothetical protein